MVSFADVIAARDAGFSIFPLRPGTKDGFLNSDPDHGATRDRAKLEEYFLGKPEMNAGLWAGDDFVMIDVDAHHGGLEAWAELVKELGPLPPTWTMDTPSGGFHKWLRSDGELFGQTDLVKGKINVRAKGGYGLLQGSTFVKDGQLVGTYKLSDATHPIGISKLDNWRGRLRKRLERGTEGVKILCDLDTPEAIAAARAHIINAGVIAEGGRNNKLYELACDCYDRALSVETAGRLLREHWRYEGEFDDKEFETCINSAWVKRQNPIGVNEPARGYEALEPYENKFAKRLFWFDQTPATEATLKPRRFIVEKLLLRKIVSGLIAPGGVGKSLLSIQIAAAVVLNRPDIICMPKDGSFPFRVKEQTRVLIVNNEDPEEELRLRAQAIFKHLNLDWEKARRQIAFFSGYGDPLRLLVRDNSGTKHGDLVEHMVELIKAEGIGVVIVDPAISTHSGLDENTNPDMNALLDVYKHVCAKTECAMLAVCHTRKPSQGSSTGYVGSIDSARGAKAFTDGMRIAHTFYNMSEEDADRLDVAPEHKHRYARLDETEKNNTSERDPLPKWFRRESVTIDIPGDPQSVGVLVPHEFPAKVLAHPTAILDTLLNPIKDQKRLSVTAAAAILAEHQFHKGNEANWRKDLCKIFGSKVEWTVEGMKIKFIRKGRNGGEFVLGKQLDVEPTRKPH